MEEGINMNEDFLSIVSADDRAIIIFKKTNKQTLYANELALNLYGNFEKMDIEHIFEGNQTHSHLLSETLLKLKNHPTTEIFNLATTTISGNVKFCDAQIGYIDDEKIYIKLSFKEDKRFEIAKNNVDNSYRAKAILDYDDNFTINYCNQIFYDVFDTNKDNIVAFCNNMLSETFVEESRYSVLENIHLTLDADNSYYTEVEIMTAKGEKKWYAIDLHKTILDNSGEKIICSLLCIDQKVKIETELRDVNQYFNALQALSDDLLFRVQLNTKTLLRCDDYADVFGADIEVKNFPESTRDSGLVYEEDIDAYMDFGHQLLRGEGGSIEIRMKTIDGQFTYRRITCVPVYDDKGNVREMFGKLVNVQNIKVLEEKAHYDLLTNTLNKVTFEQYVTTLLSDFTTISNHALFFLDLDDFKFVNDTYGHAFGDFLLKELGKRLNENVRHGDLVGRVGGDEFILFLGHIPNNEMLLNKAEKILKIISQEFNDGEYSHTIKTSIGIAVYPNHGTNFEDLYRRADIALYHSKRTGKNIATVYSEDLAENNLI